MWELLLRCAHVVYLPLIEKFPDYWDKCPRESDRSSRLHISPTKAMLSDLWNRGLIQTSALKFLTRLKNHTICVFSP